MADKICINCNETKNLEVDFYSRIDVRNGKRYYSSYCKKCDVKRSLPIRQRNSKEYQANRMARIKNDPELHEAIKKQKRENSRKNFKSVMLSNAKQRAKRSGIDFNITIEDIIVPNLCPLLKIPFIVGTMATGFRYTPTLDRVDSTKGYIKGNVRVISMLANSMKTDATLEQCLTFAENIKTYFEGK